MTRLLLPGVKVLSIPTIDPNAKGGLAKGSDKDEDTVMLVVDQAKATKFAWLAAPTTPAAARSGSPCARPTRSRRTCRSCPRPPESMILDGLPAAEATKLIATLPGKGKIVTTSPSQSQNAEAP